MKKFFRALRRWRGCRRPPVVLQLHDADCGATCLQIICCVFGLEVDSARLRDACATSKAGASMGSLREAAKELGFKARGFRVTRGKLQKVRLPCIALWGADHFVVVYRVTARRVYVVDPAIGRLSYTLGEFEERWSRNAGGSRYGYVLVVEPLEEWRAANGRKPRGSGVDIWRRCWADIRRHIRPLVGIAVLAFAVQLALPLLRVALVDVGVTQRDTAFIYFVALGYAVLTLSRILAETVQNLVVTYLGVRLNVRLAGEFVGKLTTLPHNFFDRHGAGELVQRFLDHQKIQQFVAETTGAIASSALLLAVFGVVLAAVNERLFWVFVIGSVLYLLYITLFFRRIQILSYKTFRLSSARHNVIVELLAGIHDIKLHGAARRWLRKWELAHGEYLKTELNSRSLIELQSFGAGVIGGGRDLAITVLAAGAVVEGSMTLGTMFAVEAVVGQLAWPLGHLALQMSKGQDAKHAADRIAEIRRAKSERGADGGNVGPGEDIDLMGVSFRYGAGPVVLRNISMSIPAGTTTAIVGVSGSGKSTLLKLLLKYYEPMEGRILVGGRCLSGVAPSEWQAVCGVVLQDSYVFSDSIAGNVALGEEQIDGERLSEAAGAACIDDFVEGLPGRYQTRLGRTGLGISQGQSQRVLIARALYRRPGYVFLDEATSALDAATEARVAENLRRMLRGRTAVLAAHRVSTIMHADQIVVLGDGEIREKGSHEQLLAGRGIYYELVRGQLAGSGGAAAIVE